MADDAMIAAGGFLISVGLICILGFWPFALIGAGAGLVLYTCLKN